MVEEQPDVADRHLDRWAGLWSDPDGRDRETEGALYRMVHIQGISAATLRGLLRDAPVTYDEFLTLHQLSNGQREGYARATPAELAERGGVTRAAMTGRVAKLVGKGLVSRAEDETDRRHQIITMTPAGYQVWFALLQKWSKAERALLAPLTITEIHQLNALLRRVINGNDASSGR